jgi:hypothetical protein
MADEGKTIILEVRAVEIIELGHFEIPLQLTDSARLIKPLLGPPRNSLRKSMFLNRSRSNSSIRFFDSLHRKCIASLQTRTDIAF